MYLIIVDNKPFYYLCYYYIMGSVACKLEDLDVLGIDLIKTQNAIKIKDYPIGDLEPFVIWKDGI